jgi:hypothetical protein
MEVKKIRPGLQSLQNFGELRFLHYRRFPFSARAETAPQIADI